MAIELEIQDGSPHWYLSPNVWVVNDPNDVPEGVPLAGTPCYLKARVRNTGTSNVTNATVRFYWANPSIGVNRSTATLIGQSFVSLNAGSTEDVLCLTPWLPVFLNEGHECILAEAFHDADPLPATTDFNVPTDRHVAQRNLSVIMAMGAMFHMNFEIHNGERTDKKFTVIAEQLGIEKLLKQFPQLEKQLKGKKEGKVKELRFTDTKCLGVGAKNEKPDKSTHTQLKGFEKQQMAVTGKLEGDYAFITVNQLEGKTLKGGLGIIITNNKK